MLEARVTRAHAGLQSNLCPEESDQVVGGQIDPQFLLANRPALAARHVQFQHHHDVEEVKPGIPSAFFAGTGPRTDGHLGDAPVDLFNQHFYLRLLQALDQELVAIHRTCQERISSTKDILDLTHQAQSSADLGRLRSHRDLQHRTGGQTNHSCHAHQREPRPLCWSRRRWVMRLILGRVAHGNCSAIIDLNRSMPPSPTHGCFLPELLAIGKCQNHDHLARQARPRSVIAIVVGARSLKYFRHSLGDAAVDEILTRATSGLVLLQENRQSRGRSILPNSVLGNLRFGEFQQLRAGEYIEEVRCLQTPCLATDVRLTLLKMKSGTTISQGWPRGRFDGRVAASPYEFSHPFSIHFKALLSDAPRATVKEVPLCPEGDWE